ncbi:MFS transporter [Streptomyces coelicoflavus]|uniref:MFS transporter n=1 Tax=Streptomyces coelicoflavus TaxID=285562 RepID=A0A7K3PVD6_9ACTN|nr:MFS transporter [Streptomyces coelicoflavus]NEB13942.1 MFS transporter [Streptomyces coelicoflavus]
MSAPQQEKPAATEGTANTQAVGGGAGRPDGEPAWEAATAVVRVQRRTVRLLSAAQVIGGVGVGVASSLGSLLAEDVAQSETYAGLARTAMTAGAALVGVPLAFLAQRRGRRASLSAGWLTAAIGGFILVGAAVVGSISLLALGMLLFGIGSATNQQSRYAAADLAEPHRRARALSVVVWSTTIGSVIGPNLADPGAAIATTLHLPPLTGAFLLSSICMTAASLLLWLWLRPDPLLLSRQRAQDEQARTGGPRSPAASASMTGTLRLVGAHLRRAPRAAFAFLAVVLAHTVMVAVMTMTPVSMARHGETLTVVGITISGHLLGMYAFSPVVGWLADRYGYLTTMLVGQAVFVASALLSGLSGGSVAMVMAGLFLLGLGWSFSLVAGSAMLSEATPAGLRPGMQGAADTAMNVVAAVGASLSGPLMSGTGFGGLNAFAGILVLPVVGFSFLLARGGRRRTC